MGAIRKYDPPDTELRELVEKARRRTSEQSTLDFAVDCVRLGYRAGRAVPRPPVEPSPASPPPPAENARAGADEADAIAKRWYGRSMTSPNRAAIIGGACDEAYAAGRARGIEEALRKVAGFNAAGNAIADAIARETTK